VIYKPQHANAGEHLLEVMDNKAAIQLSDSNNDGNTAEAEDGTISENVAVSKDVAVSEDSTLTQLSDELSESKTSDDISG